MSVPSLSARGKGIDAVIHLAALSNDFLGELNPELTQQINFEGTLKLARLAKKAGVKRFVYSSSQSMYGISNLDEELDEDLSEKNPLTVYARTKWEAECELKKLHSKDFTVVCFRPSTVFGASPMLRCDIIFNNLLGCAFTKGRIEIKSDGTQRSFLRHIVLLVGLSVTDIIIGLCRRTNACDCLSRRR